MPKIGAPEGAADRPYRTVCGVCGCLCEKVVSRFGYTGEPVAWAYVCQIWQHRCGTEDHEACKPRRVYTDTPEGAAEVVELLRLEIIWGQRAELDGYHVYDDGHGGVWQHPGPAELCTMPECASEPSKTDVATSGDGPWSATPAAYVALIRAGGNCFEGDCGQCAACKLKAAGY